MSEQSEMGELLGSSYSLRHSVEEWLQVTMEAAGNEALDRAGPIINDFLQHLKPIIQHSRLALVTLLCSFIWLVLLIAVIGFW